MVISATARPVRLVADPTVATLTVEGPHTLFREGATLRVEGPDRAGGYQVERKGSLARWLSQASSMGSPLTIRINPTLDVVADVMAGSLDAYGLRGTFTFTVSAGSLKAVDCSGPFDGSVQAGSAKLDGRVESGESSLRVASGSLDLRLLPGSDVHVVGRSEMGEVKVDGRHTGNGRSADVTVGSGKAVLRIDVSMGSAKVHTP